MKNLTDEEIENLSYEELAKMILENKKGEMKIIDIFKKICELKHLTDKDFEDKIADFSSKTSKLGEIKAEFEERKLGLENVVDAKKLLNDINHRITAVID